MKDQDRIATATLNALLQSIPKDEPMTTPDPDSGAIQAIAQIICSMPTPTEGSTQIALARAILAHLREHPDHGPWPVITKSELYGVREFDSVLPILVIPDPPAAEPVPSVEDLMLLVKRYAADDHDVLTSTGQEERDLMKDARKRSSAELRHAFTRLVEAATKGADHD